MEREVCELMPEHNPRISGFRPGEAPLHDQTLFVGDGNRRAPLGGVRTHPAAELFRGARDRDQDPRGRTRQPRERVTRLCCIEQGASESGVGGGGNDRKPSRIQPDAGRRCRLGMPYGDEAPRANQPIQRVNQVARRIERKDRRPAALSDRMDRVPAPRA